MTDAFKVEVKGLKETLKNLDTLEDKLRTKIVRKALRAGNFRMYDKARASTYTTFERQTGLIQQSMGVRTQINISGDFLVSFVVANPQATIRLTKNAFLSVARRPRAAGKLPPKAFVPFYWRFLERGTNPRSTSSGASRGSGPVRSWLAPAFETTAQEAIDTFAKVAKEMTDEAIASMPKTV
jgi:HK97 gp10 family phage protein